MIQNDAKILKLLYGDCITHLSEQRGITVEEAKKIFSSLTFKEYCGLIEQIVTPPSGQAITPTQGTKDQKPAQSSNTPDKNIKAIWPGKGAPVERDMTVGLTGPDGKPIPGTVTQVDLSAKGVKVQNPTTGKEEWFNIDNLTPFMASTNKTPGQTQESVDLSRLKQLAGIMENSSAGAVSTANIAIANTTLQNGEPIRRRTKTEEKWTKEYKEIPGNKTIVGDTKPHQAIGELSANLAASGKISASRGKKKKPK